MYEGSRAKEKKVRDRRELFEDLTFIDFCIREIERVLDISI